MCSVVSKGCENLSGHVSEAIVLCNVFVTEGLFGIFCSGMLSITAE